MLNLPRVLAARAARFRAVLSETYFAPTDAQSLNLFRFLFCGHVALLIAAERLEVPLSLREALAMREFEFTPIRLFALLGIGSWPLAILPLLKVILTAALACAAVGLLTRWALTASWIGFFLFYGTKNSLLKPYLTDSRGHLTDMVIFVLCILSVSPGVDLWGADGWLRRRRPAAPPTEIIPAWPLQTVRSLLAIAYFGAAFSKLRTAGIGWAKSENLQSILLGYALMQGKDLNTFVIRHPGLLAALDAATLVIESAFFLVLFMPAYAWILIASGIAMHLAMQVTMNKPYLFSYFGAAYWSFLSWPALRSLLNRERSPQPAATPAAAGVAERGRFPAKAFIAALLGVQLFCIFANVSAWPFTNWVFFPSRHDYRNMVVYRFQEIQKSGGRRWLTQPPAPIQNDMIYSALKTGDVNALTNAFREVIAGILREKKNNLSSLLLFKCRLRRSSDGRFESIEMPLIEIPVPGKLPPLSRELLMAPGEDGLH